MTEELKKKIKDYCFENSTVEDGPFNTYKTLIEGASFGYSLAEAEIERLKVEVERLNSMYLLAMKLNLNNTL